jgi:hypothetical protein
MKSTMKRLVVIHLLHLHDFFLLRDNAYVALTRQSLIYVTSSKIPYFLNMCEMTLRMLEMSYSYRCVIT